MRTPRGLTAEEAEAWAKLAASVTPLAPRKPAPPARKAIFRPRATGEVNSVPIATPPRRADFEALLNAPAPSGAPPGQRTPAPPPAPASSRLKPEPGLDSHWDRRFRAGSIRPDFTLDLHGHTLDSAHARLDTGLAQARAMGARVVLLIAGKPRPVEHMDRAERRGAIRAKLLDWLAAGPHGSVIAAVRKAHVRHGGDGALYLILKKERQGRP